MELNEVKKALYKQDPTAYFKKATKAGLLYDTVIAEPVAEHPSIRFNVINFLIPFEEIGDATFERDTVAKLLIRYII